MQLDERLTQANESEAKVAATTGNDGAHDSRAARVLLFSGGCDGRRSNMMGEWSVPCTILLTVQGNIYTG